MGIPLFSCKIRRCLLYCFYYEKEGNTMNERLLLEAATTLGYRLAMSGAETFRVEESIQRVLKT